jgi:hypothetical protein
VISERDSKIHECQVEDNFTNIEIKTETKSIIPSTSDLALTDVFIIRESELIVNGRFGTVNFMQLYLRTKH